jgi:hypothetical protein
LAIFALLLGLALDASTARAVGPGPRPLWSFHAGAPLSGAPGVGADGSFALGTLDGYVHALSPDGVFRFSYTVAGRVVGSPVVLDDGLVIVASDKNRLYALRPDGSLAWTAFVSGGVVSSLARDANDRIWFRTGANTVVAYSRRGGVVGFAKPPRAMTLGPAAFGRAGVLLASPDGELGLIGDYGKFRRAAVPGPVREVWAYEPGFLALGTNTLRELDAGLRAGFTRVGVHQLLCTTPLVVREDNEIRWLARDGSVRTRVTAPAPLARPAACKGSSLFAVDGRGGVVQLRSTGESMPLDGPAGALVGLAVAPPAALVAAYQDGRVLALKAVF